MTDFVHLHVHTQYSLLDGTIRLEDLFKKAREYQMKALAMTDHGNIFGAVDFYRHAQKYGIKPIIGCELYVAPGSRFDKTATAKDSARHLIVLAENKQGYENLMRLTSAGYLEGHHYRPRVDKALLQECHQGLIGLSACLHGEVCDGLKKGNQEAALRAAAEYRDIFGHGNFYLEIMDNGMPGQKEINEGLIQLAKSLSLPVVATNDCHYLNPGDVEAHEVLLCIQTGKTLQDAERMRFETDRLYFRSPEEMTSLFRHLPEAIRSTTDIAERCHLSFEFGNFYLPRFDIEADEPLDEWLRKAAVKGLEKRRSLILKDKSEGIWDVYGKRLAEELGIIKSMGFAGYFLIVADFVNYAKDKKIPVGPGRGSAAGSLVAYSLGITTIDPIRYGLFFERFLNPSRKSMPDIDIDFCQEGRDEIIRYVTDRYGEDKVAQIITFGKMQAKAVIRDVGRAMNIPYGEVDAIAKMVPNILNISLDEAIRIEPRLQDEEKNNEKIKKLLSFSRSLEGLNRHASIHAAGVVISDVPLVQRVPLYRSPKDENAVVTQFSMKDLELLGLTKFDFLGLKTLTVINKTLQFVKEGRGEDINIDGLSLDDPETYQLLGRGASDGVFQLESAGMKDLLVNMKPDCIEDVIALIALYRPGPMNMIPDFIARKQGKTKITHDVPELKEILKETYGVIVYQEQVMQIASVIGNYTMAEADNLRKLMSKKKPEEMEREKPKFLLGAKTIKISEQKAQKIWDQMETFGQYGFNKSHSTAYAMISYQTAYLKAHYPVEFMAALLTSEKDNRDNIIKYINGCKEMGINVLPPDVNESFRDFSVVGDHIRFGLAAVKNVGVGAVDAIIEARGKGGRFQSFYDFCIRVDLRKINKRMVESLIKCGAFDSLGHKRRQLSENFDYIMEMAHRHHQERASGQVSLFDQEEIQGRSSTTVTGDVHGQDVPEWNLKELLAYEKEVIGFYITSHPLTPLVDRLKMVANTDASTVMARRDKDVVTFGGIVSAIREIKTKKNDVMAYVTLEDLKGSIEVIFFGDVYKHAYPLLHGHEPVLIKGVLDVSEESVKVKATEISLLSEVIDQPFQSVHFMIDLSRLTAGAIEPLYHIIVKHKGKQEGFIHLLNDVSETVISLGKEVKLDISPHLKKEADHLLGTGATQFE